MNEYRVFFISFSSPSGKKVIVHMMEDKINIYTILGFLTDADLRRIHYT